MAQNKLRKIDFKQIHTALLSWYDQEKRILPWRKNRDPYRIWISEIMLQQTRVEAVIPYYERFLSRFPHSQALAEASEDEVTALWAGLGYYSRARNLRTAAQQIQSEFAGKFPQTYDQIIRLKGIGPYTAAAICSMALDQPYAAIDGNLERVIARILALRENPKTLGYASVEKVANELVKLGRAGDVNQAFMDLSASYCLPKNPLCMLCPLARFCEAKKKNLCAEIPLKEKKPEPILLPSQGLILFHKEEILLAKRSPGNWLAGLWDIPWWTEKDIKPTLSSLILPRPYGKTKLKRSITKYQLDFQVSFYRLTKKPTKAMLQKSFGSVAQDWQWLPLANGQDMLPRPTQKALQSALKTLK